MVSNSWVFDIETNYIDNFANLQGLTVVHCIAMQHSVTGEKKFFGPKDIEKGLEFLMTCDEIVGHNALTFDVPALKKLYPEWSYSGRVRDTLILSRMSFPSIKEDDWSNRWIVQLPKNLRGMHSLESWGHRMGCLKGGFGGGTDWAEYTPEMGEYCKQDVEVGAALYEFLRSYSEADASTLPDKDAYEHSVEIEHEFAAILQRQMMHGFQFDRDAGVTLYSKLLEAKTEIEKTLSSVFPPRVDLMKTPQYWTGLDGERYKVKKDAPSKMRRHLVRGPLREKITPFNPGSRSQIASAFIDERGWTPTEFTANGSPKIDESVLSKMPYPEAAHLAEYLMIVKRLGQLAEGDAAYLKLEQGGRIHGRVNHYGTVTGRCTHAAPNVAQTASVRVPYGREFRRLFIAPAGRRIVGVDASQLELRCLAHYMRDEAYVNEIVSGDIHTLNQRAAGLPTRDISKVFAYAVCYGAGSAKLGEIVGKGPGVGSQLKKRFLRQLPALDALLSHVDYVVENRGYLCGLLGQPIPVTSKHKGLNYLLQGAGASIMKVATVLAHRYFEEEGLSGKVDQVAHIHDEIQFEVDEDVAEEVGRLAVRAIEDAGASLNLRCPMGGEYKVGMNWEETH
jgi:hypothetical protein